MAKRVIRESWGTVIRIAPIEVGALAQCSLCPWGRFFPDRKRMRFSAMARAAASLRAHNKTAHPNTRLHITTSAELLAEMDLEDCLAKFGVAIPPLGTPFEADKDA